MAKIKNKPEAQLPLEITPGVYSIKSPEVQEYLSTYANIIEPNNKHKSTDVEQPPSHCGKWTLIGRSSSNEMVLVRLYCHSWSCPRCGKKKRQAIRRRLDKLGSATIFQLVADKDYSLANDALSKLLRRLRNGAIKFRYLVLAKSKIGRTEFELYLPDTVIDATLMQKMWVECGGRALVKVRCAHKGWLLRESFNEFVRDMGAWDPHWRLIRTSKGFWQDLDDHKGDKEGEWRWSLSFLDIEHLKSYYVEMGWIVVEDSEDVVKLKPPPDMSVALSQAMVAW
jgi:hypothetical protein